MVTGPVQQPTILARPPAARPHPGALPDDLRAFAVALAVPPTEPRWRECVLSRLRPVGQGFVEHVRSTEGASGLYRELLAHSPRLDRRVRLLTREHTAILAAILTVQRAAEQPDACAEELRGRAGLLLRALARHRQRGADLLWQAYQTDLGGET
ncbi:hypothetical protein ACFOW4_21115 [Micromonospora sp. GCM10011542]|uniref:hypothetical protein n=1 Tax=Micromonospora sp. GCM10011542 TaxID=3317337 RepID=UPI0036099897